MTIAPTTENTPLDTESPRVLEVLDPRDGSVASRTPVSSPAETERAVQRARDAFRTWSTTSPGERGSVLRAAAEHLREHAEELAASNTRETGKVPGDALGGVMAGIDTLLQYAELGPLHRGEALRGNAGSVDFAVPTPRGVVLALTPWNDPVAVACGLLGAAIVSGDTVVHKPSERCPATGALLNRLLAEALPDGVLVGVDGDAATGEALLAAEGVAVYAHVGSTATGDLLAEAALRTRAHVVRENGGNDALVVDRDVDPVWAAGQAALGAFANTGQICTSVERVYVHRDVAEAFTAALVAEAEQRTASDAATYGPLVDERMRQVVQAHVDDAVAAGATVLAGGSVPDSAGTFYPATVLADCTPSMLVMHEETFGPVAPITVVDDFEEGLRLAADDRYGLAATVLTNDTANAFRAGEVLPVGTVKVNAVFGGAPGGSAQPRGASGAGFGYGPHLLDEMTSLTVVHLEPGVRPTTAGNSATSATPGNSASSATPGHDTTTLDTTERPAAHE